MDILQLGAFESNDDRDRVTYAVRLYEVYPSTLGSMEYSYGQMTKVSVYRLHLILEVGTI
jgi:hypothetical protein